MARVTVEDCVDKVPNRFDLVLLSAHRAREISGGSELTIDRDRDKNPVVALREIAEQTIRPVDLKAVSYTHLDVYKRQMKKGATAGPITVPSPKEEETSDNACVRSSGSVRAAT